MGMTRLLMVLVRVLMLMVGGWLLHSGHGDDDDGDGRGYEFISVEVS